MGYFRSLMKQSGLGRVTAGQRRSLAIDVEETRTAQAPPPQLDSPKGTPPPIAIPNVPEVQHTSLPLGDNRPLTETRTQPRSEASPAPPAVNSTPDAEPPVVRIGKHESPEPVRTVRPVTFEEVRAWVAEPFRGAPEKPPAAAAHPNENVSAAWPAPHPVETADQVTLEIGAIQILIEEPRPGLVAPQPAAKQAEAPVESWTLPSRHYLRP
jgi:hypothetical protein